MKIFRYAFAFTALLASFCDSLSQVELVDISNPLYAFLKESQVSGYLEEYNSSLAPVSRWQAAKYLSKLNAVRNSLPPSYRDRLNYFLSEFEYDLTGKTKLQNNLLGRNYTPGKVRTTHLYYYTDSTASLFADIDGSMYYRNKNEADDYSQLGYGNYGFGLRAALFKAVGAELRYKKRYELGGGDDSFFHTPFFGVADAGKDGFRENKSPTQDYYYYSDVQNVKYPFDYTSYSGKFEGYLRYSAKNEWASLMFGRSRTMAGFGYVDRLFLSDNSDPFDFGSLELKYKSVVYRFLYGSVNGYETVISRRTGNGNGSSNGFPVPARELSSKNIVSHYLGINFSKALRLGFWESVVVSEQPFSFTYLNPVSFLTSADLSSGDESTTNNNSLIGIEAEVNPADGIAFHASLLIDDLTFETLFEDDSLNENKFGWQIGGMWTGIPEFSFSLEYTHLDPFVYSHRSNKSTFTNNSFSLGHSLPPNSDELALLISYVPDPFFRASLSLKHQRSGYGVDVDSTGRITANYGGYITFGFGDAYLKPYKFLEGTRVNRDYAVLNLSYEFVRQLFAESRIEYRRTDLLDEGTKQDDLLFEIGLRLSL